MANKIGFDYGTNSISWTIVNQDIRKIISLFILCICILFSCTDKRQKNGEEIVSRIELYKKATGRLPNNLSDVGIEEKESGPIYYDKKSDTSYIVYYGLGLGESMVYNFQTKKWNSDHQ